MGNKVKEMTTKNKPLSREFRKACRAMLDAHRRMYQTLRDFFDSPEDFEEWRQAARDFRLALSKKKPPESKTKAKRGRKS